MGKLDDMRAAAKGTGKPPPARKPASPETPVAKKSPAKKPNPAAKPPTIRVKFTCGHEFPVLDLQGAACSQCVRKSKAARRLRNAKKRKDRYNPDHPVAAKESGPSAGRLPDGSAFAVSFDATAVRWSGTLTVPGHPPFTADHHAVFKLLGRLDVMFRNATKPPETADVPDPVRPSEAPAIQPPPPAG